jgi:hypothetical protein
VAVVGLLADSIEDVPEVWTPLLGAGGVETETSVCLRAYPAKQVQAEIRRLEIKTKHMSVAEKARHVEGWYLDHICKAFVDSKEWEAPFFGAEVVKGYRKFFPDLEPGLFLMDGKWTDALKRKYFQDEPGVLQQVWQTLQGLSVKRQEREEGDEKKGAPIFPDGSPSD